MIGDDRIGTIQGVDYTYDADTRVNTGDPLVGALLELRNNLEDAAAVMSKSVTTTNVAGTGQIENTGAVGNVAIIRFDVFATDTIALSPRDYFFNVKCTTASGAVFYAARGLWRNAQP